MPPKTNLTQRAERRARGAQLGSSSRRLDDARPSILSRHTDVLPAFARRAIRAAEREFLRTRNAATAQAATIAALLDVELSELNA